jgi:hypothetical protein
MAASLVHLQRPSRRTPLALCVAALFGLSVPTFLHAASWAVNNCRDDASPGSLRWAANGAVNGDTIDININDTTNCVANQDGFAQSILLGSAITLATGSVSINGPNASGLNLAVSGNNFNHRVFSSAGTLTINDLGVIYGKNTSSSGLGGYYGGCIYAHSGADLSNVILDHCTTYASAGVAKGGAVGTFNGYVLLTNSKITHSYAKSNTGSALGGGVYAFGNVTLAGTSYIRASASVAGAAGGSAKGGGVWTSGNASVQHSTIHASSANSQSTSAGADALGGAIYAQGAVLLNKALLDHASTYAKGRYSRGGGIYSKGLASVDYSILRFNAARGTVNTRGGAIYSTGGLNTKYSNFGVNRSDNGQGGGAVVRTGNSSIRGSTLYSNYSRSLFSTLDLWAGGSSAVSITNSTISGNTTGGATANYAVYIKAHTTAINNSTFAYNYGGSAAGVFVRGSNLGATLDLKSTLMSSNKYTFGPKNDLFVESSSVSFTAGSSNNLIRNPGSAVPAGTITGQCPLLHKLGLSGSLSLTHRPGGGISASAGSKNPVIDTGSNPLALTSDQRGGLLNATSPPRVSGSAADIGAYEVDQSDFIFDAEFEGCP